MENKKNNQTDNNAKPLQGNEVTREQFSDVYAAGTSDGIHQLADKQIKIKHEPYTQE